MPWVIYESFWHLSTVFENHLYLNFNWKSIISEAYKSNENHKCCAEQNLCLFLVNILLSSLITFAYVWSQILVFWNQITVWHVINFLPNLCWQKQVSAVLASVCPSVPTDAQPSTGPSPSSTPPPPPGPFCWWQGRLISAYLAPTLRSDTGTIGNIWPRDAESGQMEAKGEKEGCQYKRVIGGAVKRRETHEGVVWHFVLSAPILSVSFHS